VHRPDLLPLGSQANRCELSRHRSPRFADPSVCCRPKTYRRRVRVSSIAFDLS
jgi:hypothetical protein